MAQDVLHYHSRRTIWSMPRNSFMKAESQDGRRDQSLRAVYSIAVERRSNPGRKLLVWMGCGWPSVSVWGEHNDIAFFYLVELSTRIREARMVIDEVPTLDGPLGLNFKDTYQSSVEGVRTPAELEQRGLDPSAHVALPVLATQSGGLVLDESSAMSQSIGRCIEDASEFYTISFDPPNAAKPDEYHDIQAKIAKLGLSARTTTGYYDQPVFYDQPHFPPKRVSVQELEQILGTASDEQDGELAKQLASLELGERLSSSRLTFWEKRLRGKKSIAALVALADQSAFLDPPSAEILADPAPDRDTQRQMISATVKYLQEEIPRLPNFSRSAPQRSMSNPRSQRRIPGRPPYPISRCMRRSTVRATLRNRNGHEEQDAAKKRGSSDKKKDLNFRGDFGPVLSTVLGDAARGDSKVIWSRWEQGEGGREAVFHYIVRTGDPHWDVSYCCLVGGGTFLTSPRYLGELTIDPSTGAILRLTTEAELGWIREPNLNPVLPAEG